MTIPIIAGVGIAAALLLYFAFQLDKEKHVLLQVLTLFFVLYLITLIPATLIKENDYCNTVVVNETVAGATTTYGYDRVCIESTNNTPLIFHRIVTWFNRLFVIYLFMYLLYDMFIKNFLVKLKIIKPKQ